MTQLLNPILAPLKGKGASGSVARARAIASRYGLNADKMDQSLALLADILNSFDAKATLPATAVALARHGEVASKHQGQNIELAIHGLVHVDHTQLSLDEQREQLGRAIDIFAQAGIQATGFRSPYLRWNDDTLAVLSDCGFAYDSSQALFWDVVDGRETDAYRRVLAFYGAEAATEYPALPRLSGGLVRIPYCVPDDEALVERLNLTDSAPMAELWLEMLRRVHDAGELFTVGLHPERVPLCQGALRATLEQARALSPGVWIARLDEIAAWWRALSQATFTLVQENGGSFRLEITAPPEATVLARGVQIQAPTQSWARDYRRVLATRFSFQASRRPVVGVAPNSPAALSGFLRQQGYLVEIGADPETCAFYVDWTSFDRQDERPLLEELENGDWSLVRLGRWPAGAQSALCVTGDIDAFTLLDYALRAGGR
jgi:hypothetical protein